MLGQPQSYVNDILWAIQNESTGRPNAINDWDDNALILGDPSRGLMQTIGSTFRAYKHPALSNDIYDPLSNIYAGINYMIGRYGSIENVMKDRREHWVGYAVGTRNVPYDMLAQIHRGEAILPRSQNPYSQSGGDYLGEIGNSILDSVMTALALGGDDSSPTLNFDSLPTSSNNNTYVTNNNQFTNQPTANVQSEADMNEFFNKMDAWLARIIQQGMNTLTVD